MVNVRFTLTKLCVVDVNEFLQYQQKMFRSMFFLGNDDNNIMFVIFFFIFFLKHLCEKSFLQNNY